MARRKRTKKRLSGLPSEHAKRARNKVGSTKISVALARRALDDGRCDLAYSRLRDVIGNYESASMEHMHSEYMHSDTGAEGQNLSDKVSSLLSDFGRECVRQPKKSWLDRFRKRKE